MKIKASLALLNILGATLFCLGGLQLYEAFTRKPAHLPGQQAPSIHAAQARLATEKSTLNFKFFYEPPKKAPPENKAVSEYIPPPQPEKKMPKITLTGVIVFHGARDLSRAFVKIDAAVSQPSGQVKSQAPYGRRLPETGFPGNREHLSRMNPGMLNQRGLHGQAFRKGVVREELHPANVAQTPFISRGQAGADAEIILSEGDDIRPGLKVVAIEAGRMVVLFAGKHKAINLSGNDSASGLIAAVSSKPINK